MTIKKYAFEISFYEGLHKRMPKDLKVVSILAQLYTESGLVKEGLKMDRKIVRLDPDDPTAHYNLACSLALKSRLREAVKSLKTAIKLGYTDYHWMRNDPDLAELQDYDPFKHLIHELEIG